MGGKTKISSGNIISRVVITKMHDIVLQQTPVVGAIMPPLFHATIPHRAPRIEIVSAPSGFFSKVRLFTARLPHDFAVFSSRAYRNIYRESFL